MIIEITDIPEGRKIKSVNFNINFEESDANAESLTFDTDTSHNEQEKKDIPSEMKDLEF